MCLEVCGNKVVDYSGSFWKETCRRFQIDVLLGNGWNCGEGSILNGSRRYGLCYQPDIKERVETLKQLN